MRTKLENNARGCAFALALTRRTFVGMASAAMLAFSGCVLCDNLPPRPIGGSDEAWAAITNGAPVPRGIGATEMLALNIAKTFSTANQRGVAQAKAVLFFILVTAISLIQLRATRSKEVQQ